MLEVLADDDRAVGCYRNVGFVEEGRLRERDWANGAFHDVMVMAILAQEWPGAAYQDAKGMAPR